MNTAHRNCAITLFAAFLIATVSTAQQPTPSASEAIPSTTSSQDSAPVSSNSKVRIVRLSEVRGTAQLDRNTGSGFEAAIPNMPIVERSRLRTGMGVAEVEFEDNSSLRIAPDSLVMFTQLELLSSGAKASTIEVQQGMVYVSLATTKGNVFTLNFGHQTLHLQPASHIRLQLEPGSAKLAVLDGNAEVEGPAGVTLVGKKKTVTLSLANQSEPVVAKNVVSNELDSWDHQAVDYHKRSASMAAFGNAPNSYGMSDMMYYGSFNSAGGCGSMWRPYFVSSAWQPYSNGVWAYYPSAGYTWVSPYPWGWTPFHSGNWAFCPGTGWGWQPGNTWYGLNNPIALTPVKGQPVRSPMRPVRPPVFGRPTLVPVNDKPLPASALRSPETFVFRQDSAGMGVPRGSLGKLNGLSEHAAQHGSASTPVSSPVGTSGQVGGQTAGQVGGQTSNAGLASSPSAGYSGRPGSISSPGTSGVSSGGGMSSGGSRPSSPSSGGARPH